MTELRRRTLLGLDFVDAPYLSPVVDALLAEREPSGDRLPVTVTPNVDILVRLAEGTDPAVARLYGKARFVLPDGQPVVWLSKVVGEPLSARLPGSTLFGLLWTRLAEADRDMLVIASTGVVADRLRAEHPRAAYVVPGLIETGRPGAVDSLVDECFEALGGRRPEFVLSGLGMVKDALLVERLFARWPAAWGPLPEALCLGGSFEMHVGLRRRAPQWVQHAGMEWFFRFCQEPRRLFRRYFVTDPYFAVLAWREVRSQRPGLAQDAAPSDRQA